jgi:hypothetical protein
VTPSLGNQGTSARRGPALRFCSFVAAIAAGLTATVHDNGASWFGLRGPQCPLGNCLGPLACPGCGLLRSTAATLQGDLGFAFAMHPAGPVVAALLVAGALLHFDVLRRRAELPLHRSLRTVGHRIFVAGLLLGWLVRVAT